MKIEGSAVNGGTHQDRVNLPRPTAGGVRPAHRQVQPKPRGLDWTALKPTCRTCGTKTGDLNRDDQCRACSAASPAPEPAAAPRRSARTKGQQAGSGSTTRRRRVVDGKDSPATYAGGWVQVGGILRPATPANVRAARRAAAQYAKPIGPRARPGHGPERIQLDGAAIAAAYQSGQTLAQLAAEHDVSAPTIARALDDNGVVRRRQRVDYTPAFLEEVRALYVDEGLDQQRVGQRLGVTTKVVQTAMARGGIHPRESASARSQRGIGHPIKITPDIAEEILTRYRAGEAGPQIAAAYEVSAASIYHLLAKHGVPRHGRRTPGLGRDGSIGLKQRIRDLGVSAREINQWALAVGLMDLPKPGLPSAATVDAWEDARTGVAS